MKKVLVVDDKPNIVMLVRAKLAANGFEVFTAYNGKEALRVAEKEKPDLILLDIMMPGMDGFEVFMQIKDIADLTDVPVIFLTASGKRSDESKALEMGAAFFLTKPFSPNRLIEIVTKVMKGT